MMNDFTRVFANQVGLEFGNCLGTRFGSALKDGFPETDETFVCVELEE
jgi:hypothetical protein